MDSKTRVLNALNGKSIDRLPMWYGAEPALTEKIARHLGVQGEEAVLQALDKEYHGRVTFFGAIDYNSLLSNGTQAEVEQGVRDMIDILGYDRGMIVAPSHDLMMAEVPAENVVAMFQTAKTYSPKYCR